jgi:hypothetical protein
MKLAMDEMFPESGASIWTEQDFENDVQWNCLAIL